MSQSPAALLAGAYFPGPRSENEAWVPGEFEAVLDQWFDWRKALFADDPPWFRRRIGFPPKGWRDGKSCPGASPRCAGP